MLAGGRVRATSGRLADGRAIHYYDDSEPFVSGGATRHVPDTRRLPALEVGSVMRHDPLTGEWVTLAVHRNERTHLPPQDLCPLCPTGQGSEPSEVPSPRYDVVVFENRFPSLSQAPDEVSASVDGLETWAQRSGFGQCEVVCFTAEHDASFATLTPDRVRTVVEAWADRTRALSEVPGIEQVFPFENRGEEIGVTLHHPHGQIYGYPYVTPRTDRMLDLALAHRRSTGGNLLRDVLEAEQQARTRVVLEAEHWTAYVPAAARWPFEVHLAPHRDVPDLPALDDAERAELSAVYLELVQRADRFYDGATPLPYIAGWHQAPTGARRDLGRLHLQLFSPVRAPRQAQVPRRLRVRDGRLGQRPPTGAGRGEVARGRLVTSGPDWYPAPDPDGLTERVTRAFGAAFDAAPAGVWAAPGRVNLIGEHVDYNRGLCLPFALGQRTFVAVRPRDDARVRVRSEQRPDAWDGLLDDIRPGLSPGWVGYVAGVLFALRSAGFDVPGLDVLVDSEVPAGSGLSSSAALECAVAVAVDELAGTGLGEDDGGRARLAALCVRAENEIAGAPTGGMDQAAALRSREAHAFVLDCQAFSVEHVPLDLAGAGLALLVIDTRAHHSLIDGQYGSRRDVCDEAARLLGVESLRDIQPGALDGALAHLAARATTASGPTRRHGDRAGPRRRPGSCVPEGWPSWARSSTPPTDRCATTTRCRARSSTSPVTWRAVPERSAPG